VPCNVAFGLAVTNVVPRQVPLSRGGAWGHSSLAVSRLTERFVVRLESDGRGPPRLTAVRGFELDLDDEFLPVLGDRSSVSSGAPARLTAGQVTQVLLASSGIPGIFDPVRLEFTVDDGQGPRYHAGCFMDGGVLDNVPLSTAIRLAEHDKVTRAPPGGTAPAAFYLYVDPDNVEGPISPPREPAAKLGPALGTLLGNLVRGARQAELVRTMEDKPEARLRLRLPGRKHVITGELLSAFGAFLDLSFRRFDFLAGMADAQRALRGSVFYEEVHRRQLDQVASPAFACFEKVWTSPAAMDSEPACLALRDSTCQADRCGASERDLWRLLHTSVALDQRRDDPALTQLFFEQLSTSTGARIDGAATPGYEYLTLKLGGHVARPQEGQEAAREQLQRLVAGVARGSNDWLLRPAIDTAGTTLMDAALGYHKVGVSWWLGLLGHGPETGYARRLWRLPLDAVAELQVAEVRFAPAIKTGRLADMRLRAGLRAEAAVSPVFQLQGGANFGVQAVWLHGYQPLYRANWSVRGDVQILQRLYFALEWARGLGESHPVEPRTDLNFGLGVRWWLD
jgi:hypothetical protein